MAEDRLYIVRVGLPPELGGSVLVIATEVRGDWFDEVRAKFRPDDSDDDLYEKIAASNVRIQLDRAGYETDRVFLIDVRRVTQEELDRELETHRVARERMGLSTDRIPPPTKGRT